VHGQGLHNEGGSFELVIFGGGIQLSADDRALIQTNSHAHVSVLRSSVVGGSQQPLVENVNWDV